MYVLDVREGTTKVEMVAKVVFCIAGLSGELSGFLFASTGSSMMQSKLRTSINIFDITLSFLFLCGVHQTSNINFTQKKKRPESNLCFESVWICAQLQNWCTTVLCCIAYSYEK